MISLALPLMCIYRNVLFFFDSWDHYVLHGLRCLSWYLITFTLYNGPLHLLHYLGYILSPFYNKYHLFYKMNYYISKNSFLVIYNMNIYKITKHLPVLQICFSLKPRFIWTNFIQTSCTIPIQNIHNFSYFLSLINIG